MNIGLFKTLLNSWLLFCFFVRLINYDYFVLTSEFVGVSFYILDSLNVFYTHPTYVIFLTISILITIILFFKTSTPLCILQYILYIILIFHRRDSIVGGDTFFYILGFWNLFISSQPTSEFKFFLNNLTIKTIMVQIMVVYFSAGIAKTMGTTWLNGEALSYVLDVDEFKGVQIPFLLNNLALLSILTWSTMLFQIMFPILFLNRHTKYYIMIIGIVFHSGTIFLMNLPKFLIFPISYILFWNHNEFKAIIKQHAKFFQR